MMLTANILGICTTPHPVNIRLSVLSGTSLHVTEKEDLPCA